MAKAKSADAPIIIIKKKKKGGKIPHHGGAWKVAYADFVTAMMAFFLLLWLLNVTTDEQKAAIASYFDPAAPKIAESTSGSGGVMGGKSMTPDGAFISEREPIVGRAPDATPTERKDDIATLNTENTTAAEADERSIREKQFEEKQQQSFDEAKAQLLQAVAEDPELAELKENLLIDQTPEGLRIQIIDKDGVSMFARGSAEMYDKTKKLMKLVTQAISGLPNKISIRGHTDSTKYAPGAKYTNWELSADRANASRRELLANGLDQERIANVIGRSDKEHLVPEEPESERNRRISIMLLKEKYVDQEKIVEDEVKRTRLEESPSGIGPVEPDKVEDSPVKEAVSPDKYEFEYEEDELPLE